MGAMLGTVVIDAKDATAQAEFWKSVLGWRQIDVDTDGAIEIAADEQRKPSLLFVPVPEDKAVKNRLHIDLSPVGCEQEDELERLLGLGARRIDIGQGETTWVVLSDPEDNEFCLLRTRVDA
jgi:predicted enzyme related to lactoylglutathione lyase